MGNLRSVGGWGEVDLDQRAITTEDDIVDLSELDRSHDQPNQPAPATQNGAAEHDEPGEGQPPAAASQSHQTPPKPHPQPMRPAGRAIRTSTAGSRTALPDWAAPSPHPSRARLRLPVTPESWSQAMLPRPRRHCRGSLRGTHGAGGHQLPQPATPRRPPIATAGPARTSSRRDRCVRAERRRDGDRDQRRHEHPATRALSDLNLESSADRPPEQPGERRAQRDDRRRHFRAPRARASGTPRAQNVAPGPQAPASPPEPQGRDLKPQSSGHGQRAQHHVRPNVAPTANVQLHAGIRHVQQHQPGQRRLTNPIDQREPARLRAKRKPRPRQGSARHPVRRHPSSAQDPDLHPPQRHRSLCPVRGARRHIVRGAESSCGKRRHSTAQEPGGHGGEAESDERRGKRAGLGDSYLDRGRLEGASIEPRPPCSKRRCRRGGDLEAYALREQLHGVRDATTKLRPRCTRRASHSGRLRIYVVRSSPGPTGGRRDRR